MNRPGHLEAALWETRRHADALQRAISEWDALPPQPWATIEADLTLVRLLDQILYRFLKLQDTVGDRLIETTLAELGEPSEDWPMRDRLDRLERLGFLDAAQWAEWRAVRNRLAHEYPDAPQLRWAALGEALAATHGLLACVSAWLIKLQPGSPKASPGSAAGQSVG